MDFISSLRTKAAALNKHIVLPEGDEPRMLHAAKIIEDSNMAQITILGNVEAIKSLAASEGVELTRTNYLDPSNHSRLEEFANMYYELRKHKGMTQEKAREVVCDPLFCGALMVRAGMADGYVAGAKNSTGDVLRAAFQCIGTAPGCSIVSSCFVMIVPNCEYGENGMMIFADCAINPNPTPEQLADIAISSAQTGKALCGFEPKVAMLSYSTVGSGVGPDVDAVVEATRIVREKAPNLMVDGELQADAALVPSIGKKKAPNSNVAGYANVLIFPDLNSANIGYKLVQRLAKAEAVGPISQGMAAPVNDLSRGCSVDDIVNVVAISCLQTQK